MSLGAEVLASWIRERESCLRLLLLLLLLFCTFGALSFAFACSKDRPSFPFRFFASTAPLPQSLSHSRLSIPRRRNWLVLLAIVRAPLAPGRISLASKHDARARWAS